jgi:integrase
MSKRIRITDATLKGLRPSPAGKLSYVWDSAAAGFGIRSTDKGAHSYVVYGRWNSRKPTRLKIAEVGEIGLAEARAKARDWLELARQGRHPLIEEREAQLAKEGRPSFGAVMEKYISRHISKTRQAREAERVIRREVMPRFGEKALNDIDRRDVAKLVGEVRDRGALYQAHHVYEHIHAFYEWAIGQEEFGIESSPCDRLQPNKLIGQKHHRTRVLSDEEIRALWRVTEPDRLPYPWGPFYRLLLLTGCRKSEAAGSMWGEFELNVAEPLWTIPAVRFKSEVQHLIPLSSAAVEILNGLPRWTEGDHVFSTRQGTLAIDGFSKAKSKLDGSLAAELGRDVTPWVTHDLRRTARTRFSELRIPTEISELIIGHGRRGLTRVYDMHAALAERREALELWAAKLRDIVTPPPANVLPIRASKERRARA